MTSEKKYKILIVDDNPTNLCLLVAILSGHGYTAYPANSGKAALRFMQSTIPDLILLDVMMPDMNGYQVCELLKAEECSRDIPVIFISAADQILDKVKAFKCGGVDYIVKPFEEEEVLSRITTHLSLRDRCAEICRINEQLSQESAERKHALERLKEAQGQLIQAEKMASIGLLAAGVAHEINNPLSYLSSNLSTLNDYVSSLLKCIAEYDRILQQDDRVQSAEVAELKERSEITFIQDDVLALLRESREGIVRVQAIVQSLKDFSRIDVSSEWQLADIHHGLDSTLNVVANEINCKAAVHKEYGDIPKIECLVPQLNQVFMNLLVNAAQSIEERGEIRIRTGCTEEQISIEIADTGKGIAPEHLARIFDPFFTTKPVGKGTGLGLSLSYSIIQDHHGQIEVESVPDQGTVFTIRLPLQQP